MRTFGKAILTKKGNELIVEATSGKQIEFTRLVTGCGSYDISEKLENITEIREPRQEFCFTEIEKINESSVLLKAVISNRNLEDSYRITEVGVYGKLQDSDNEILYSINIVNQDDAYYLPPYNGLVPTEINLSYYITIKQDVRPKVAVGDAIDILLNEIDEETRRAIEAEKNNFDAITAEVERAKEQELLKAPVESPEFTGRPTAPTPETSANNGQLATTAFVKAIVNALINGAPETMDTFREIAEAFAENDILLNALNEAIGKKLGKTENAVSASKWENGRNINGLIIDGTSNRANYGTCSTPAETAAKTVPCTGFSLVSSAEITVKFMVTNTAANPTLNVSGTGAKPIYYRGLAIPAGYLAANRTYIFRYNGEQYDLVGDIDTNTKYSLATASTRGLVKIGYEKNGNNYPVQLENEQMYVNVPWTDTKYSNFVKSGPSAKEGLVPSPGTTAGTAKYLREDGTWATPPDTNTTYSNMTAASTSDAGKAGLVPAPSAGSANRYLRSDGIWAVPHYNNTTYEDMKGATADAAGTHGLVPAPAKGNQEKYLRGDGTWQTPPDTNTTYNDMAGATASAAGKHGLVPAPAAGKQNAFLRSDGTWVTPSTSLAGNVPGIPADQTAVKALKEQLDSQNSNLSDLVNGLKLYTGTVNITSDSAARFYLDFIPAGAFGVIFNVFSTLADCTVPCYRGDGRWYSIFKNRDSIASMPNTTVTIKYSYFC